MYHDVIVIKAMGKLDKRIKYAIAYLPHSQRKKVKKREKERR